MKTLNRGDIVEQPNELLTSLVFLIKREFFNGAKDDRVCEDGGVKRMDGVDG
jgi:hypothetical protein